MANTFHEVYKKTGTNSYQLVGNVGVNGVKLDIMKGASSDTVGEIGLVPKPLIGQEDYVLTGAGNFATLDSLIEKSNFKNNYLYMTPLLWMSSQDMSPGTNQFTCNEPWDNFDLLLFNYGTYYNYFNSILMGSAEFDGTGPGTRICFYYGTEVWMEVYQGDTTDKVRVVNHAPEASSYFGLRIQGIGRKK